MARVKLKRFRVQEPSAEALARYCRAYDGRDLHFRPGSLEPITSQTLFGVDGPLVFDLGCGRGEFVVGQAQRRPAEYFVGMDWHQKSVWDAVNRAERADLDNLRIVKADFRLALKIVPDESASEVYVLFPPPLLKASKRGRDPLRAPVIPHIHRVLQPSGYFHFVTDDADYFAAKRDLIAGDGLFVLESTSQQIEGGQTRFQRFWEGFDIRSNRAAFRKVAPANAP